MIKAKQEKLDVFEVLESVIEWNSFVSSVEEAQELARPADYDYLDLLQKRFYSGVQPHAHQANQVNY